MLRSISIRFYALLIIITFIEQYVGLLLNLRYSVLFVFFNKIHMGSALTIEGFFMPIDPLRS